MSCNVFTYRFMFDTSVVNIMKYAFLFNMATLDLMSSSFISVFCKSASRRSTFCRSGRV